MMIAIQDNILINTDRISAVQFSKIKGKPSVEVIVDNRSYVVDKEYLHGEFRNFLRAKFDDKTEQFVAV